jgi:hypothetical protein
MAKARKKSTSRATRSSGRSRSSGGSMSRGRAASARGGQDAIALLKADHRQVEDWFEQFEKARDDNRKQTLATKICNALKVHTMIEEELFYPAFLEATEDKDTHHEAEIEHDGAKKLIAEIEASGPDDDYFDSKVKVLSEMIKHHGKKSSPAACSPRHANPTWTSRHSASRWPRARRSSRARWTTCPKWSPARARAATASVVAWSRPKSS